MIFSIDVEVWQRFSGSALQRFSGSALQIDALSCPRPGRIDGHTVAQLWMGHTGSHLCSRSVQAVPAKPDLILGSSSGAARSLK
jgi:hypothetical protein